MTAKQPKLIVASLLLCAAAACAAAQEPADTLRWTYADCVAHAREHNIELKQSSLNRENALSALEEANAQWAPSLSFTTTHGFTNTPWSKGNKNVYASSYGVNAAWTVWDGGRRSGEIKRNKAEVRKSENDTETLFRSIETELLSIYIDLLYAREAISVNRSQAEASAAQAERAERLMQSGRIAAPEYAQIKAQADADCYNVVSAEASYASQRMQLKRLLELGINSQLEIMPVDVSEEQVIAPLPPMEQSYAMALETDAELQGKKIAAEIAEINIRTAKSGHYPDISLQAGLSSGYYSNPGGNWATQMKQAFNENVGLTISVPIFDQKKTKTAISQAKIARLNSMLDIESRENEIARTVEDWYISMNSAQTRYSAGLSRLESARLSSDLVNERFQVGYVQVTELLQAHSTLASARHELLQAKYMALLARKMVEYLRNATVSLQ